MGKSTIIQVWENGPYTIAGNVTVNGEKAGMQSALCRCGASKNKPFCDGSHLTNGFEASGDAVTTPPAPMSADAEGLAVTSFPAGPLQVEGDCEISAGADIDYDKSKPLFLCRCGHSSNKPFCDGTHKTIDDFTGE